jgi:hypothetical protein
MDYTYKMKINDFVQKVKAMKDQQNAEFLN